MNRVIVFDSHPVQYKAPVYQELEKIHPGRFKVLYATDCSVRGYRDKEFGQTVAWDASLLEGYESRILNLERGVPLSGFRSLSGKGVCAALRKEAPRALLISQFLYEADFAALLAARKLSVPVAIRHETQDEALPRAKWKSYVRSAVYRLVYSQVNRAFYIGELNRRHLLRHGFHPEQLTRAPYCVPNPFERMPLEEKTRVRQERRNILGLNESHFVVLFSGKLIPKKNPKLVLDAVKQLPMELQRKTTVLFMGSGELDEELRKEVFELGGSVKFLGFIKQSSLAENYLAADVVVLPSRRMGETWGLVVNEALQAGCGVVMTDAVGCHAEFGSWGRVRVIPEGNAGTCASALAELSTFERSFDWCANSMQRYSVRAAAEAIASAYPEGGTLS